jgi:hypothetical protein
VREWWEEAGALCIPVKYYTVDKWLGWSILDHLNPNLNSQGKMCGSKVKSTRKPSFYPHFLLSLIGNHFCFNFMMYLAFIFFIEDVGK